MTGAGADRMSYMAISETNLKSLPLVGRGKVRDNYAVGSDRLLMVATDRISAFDVVMPNPVPQKGTILTKISAHWFRYLEHIVPNHLISLDTTGLVADEEVCLIEGRSMLVRRCTPLPMESVVRGYLAGSAWSEYSSEGTICGTKMPTNLRMASRLPSPMFTPTTKAPAGSHDQSMDFRALQELLGAERAERIRDLSIELYERAAAYALTRGVIIADTKFEFGLDADGRLLLIDEALTPDSSRYWPLDQYCEGVNPPSFDKQPLREWLSTVKVNGRPWDKMPPAPVLPMSLIETLRAGYENILNHLIQ